MAACGLCRNPDGKVALFSGTDKGHRSFNARNIALCDDHTFVKDCFKLEPLRFKIFRNFAGALLTGDLFIEA